MKDIVQLNCEIYSKELNILLIHVNWIYSNFMDLNNMAKFIMLVSNFNLLRKTANYLNNVFNHKTVHPKKMMRFDIL